MSSGRSCAATSQLATQALEYETRLDSVIEMHEVYVPRVVLPAASVQPYMNCNWDFDETPRRQLDKVECYPIVYVTPAKGGAP